MNPVPGSVGKNPFIPELTHNWESRSGDSTWSEIEGSMVLADVSGFTRVSERLARPGPIGAEEITDVIDETFGRLLSEADHLGGDLLKFGGDAVLLFFEGPNHAQRAAVASLGMRSELREVGNFETSAGRITLRMSVGAHCR